MQTIVSDTQRDAGDVFNAAPEQPVTELGGVRHLTAAVFNGSESDMEEVVVSEDRAGLHSIRVALILSLDMTRFDLIDRPELKNLEFARGDQVERYNFDNPFTRGNRDKGAAPGIIRSVLESVLRLASMTNDDHTTVLARDSDINNMVSEVATSFVSRILEQLPTNPTSLILESDLDDEEQIRPGVLFRDLFDINTWAIHTQREDVPGTDHTIYVNVSVNAASAFAQDEPFKFITRACSSVESVMKKSDSDLSNYVVVRLSSDALDQAAVLELISILTDEESGGWSSLSRRSVDLGTSHHNNMAEADHAQALFGDNADFLLIRYLGEDADEPAVEAAAEA